MRARAITTDEGQTKGHTLGKHTMEPQKTGQLLMYLLELNECKWMGWVEEVRRLRGRDTMG